MMLDVVGVGFYRNGLQERYASIESNSGYGRHVAWTEYYQWC